MGDKVEEACCFLCLQSLRQNKNNDEQISLAKLFFKYLKIRHEIKTFVCGTCGEILTKFVKLHNILEKVRLEMDYLLDSIKGLILNSNYSKPANFGVASARGFVLEKCLEETRSRRLEIVLERWDTSQIKKKSDSRVSVPDCPSDYLANYNNESDSISHNGVGSNTPNTLSSWNNRKPHIILKRLDLSKLIKKESLSPPPDCSDDWWQNSDISNSSEDDGNGFPATPVVNDVINVKCEVAFEITKNKKVYPVAKWTKYSKTFSSKKARKPHSDTVHPLPKLFKCPMCHKPFCNKGDVRTHINSVHLHLKTYKCDMCDKSFCWASGLTYHRKSYHYHMQNTLKKYLRYKCDMCDKSFSNPRFLQRHKATPHKPQVEIDPDLKLPFCEICKKTYKTEKILRKHHHRIHTAPRFPCEICKKYFKTRVDMRRHVSTVHEKQRQYCQVPGCYKSYSNPYSFVRHYEVEHPGFTPDEKRPKVPKYLEKVDGGMIVFECNFCSRTFEKEETVKKHLSKMHGSKKLVCKDCNYTTTTRKIGAFKIVS